MTKESKSQAQKRIALTSPLQTITICINDLAKVKELYVDTLEMNLSGPFEISQEAIPKLKLFWDIPESVRFEVYQLKSSNIESSLDIRVIHLLEEVVSIHSPEAFKEVGPYALGMTVNSPTQLKAIFNHVNVTKLSDQHIYEAHISPSAEQQPKIGLIGGSEEMRISLIVNEDVNEVLDPPSIDLSHAILMTDRSDEEIIFYTHVLGMQLQSDYQSVSKNKDLDSKNTKIHYRSSTLRNAESHIGLVHILSYHADEIEQAPNTIRLPNRGLTMWSFQTRDIGEILARAHAKQVKVYRTPRKVSDPIRGDIIAMTLLAPTGFIVEVYSPF